MEVKASSKRKRGKSKLDLAGLVGGDSDSSALTLESGDEAVSETMGESIAAVSDGGTEEHEEDVEMLEPSSGMCCNVDHYFETNFDRSKLNLHHRRQ